MQKIDFSINIKSSYNVIFFRIYIYLIFLILKFQNIIAKLPFYLIVPNIFEVKAACNSFLNYQFTILGMADILILGAHLNYAVIYDLTGSNKFLLYTLVNIASNNIGCFIFRDDRLGFSQV